MDHTESSAAAVGEGAYVEGRLDALLSITGRMDGFLYRCRNDASYSMLYISEGVLTVSGYPASDFINNTTRDYVSVIHPDDLAHVYATVDAGLAAGRNWHVDYRIITLRGEPIWVREIGNGVLNEAGDLVFLEGFVFDVSDRKVIEDRNAELLTELSSANEALAQQKEAVERAKEHSDHSAHHDGLTGLPNRTYFRKALEAALARRGDRVAVLCLDLDGFKNVNDKYGHEAGDQLLIEAGRRIRKCLRGTDIVARLGGDEFAVIETAVERPSDASALAKRILNALSGPFEINGRRITSGTSIGIALSPDDGLSIDELLKKSDLALYRSKNEGRGTYRFFEQEMDARMQERRALELDLREALDNDEFELQYQPLVNLESSAISAFEALIRWNQPVRGLVSPADFIPLAEETGIIVAIGEWVLHQACTEAASWPLPYGIAVNLSPIQFKSGDIVETVKNALAVSGLEAKRLELEITESVFLLNSEATLSILHRLRDLGVRIAMDDFGTGYSSLSYLQNFPFDKIKIDRSFVSNLSKGKESIAILHAITSLARTLNMTTTAEGVETKAQLDIVRGEGCTEMQGYLFSPPVSKQSLSRFFERSVKNSLAAA